MRRDPPTAATARGLALLATVALIATLLPAPVARAAGTWYVAPGGSDAGPCNVLASPCATITGALGKILPTAPPVNQIVVAPGVYVENLNINLLEVTITGAGSGATIIDGGLAGRVVTVQAGSTVSISGVTIRNGNVGGDGAGILNDNATLTLTNVMIENNTAIGDGGAINNRNGTLSVIGSTIDNNRATGGANGAAIFSDGGSLIVTNSTLSNNTAAFNGGALYVYNGGMANLNGAIITGNTASTGNGGGLYIGPGGGPVNVASSTFSGNNAEYGGGIYNIGTLTLNNSIVSSNSSRIDGAGIYNFGPGATIGSSSVSGNTANGNGGGIYINIGSVTLRRSTVDHNTSGTAGGGVVVSAALTVDNSTISANRSTGHLGGGVFLIGGGTLTLNNATITANSSLGGGGIYLSLGTVTMQNSILAGNAGGSAPDCAGAITSQGYNLVGNDNGCAFGSVAGDQAGTASSPIDPRLGPLQNNGGATSTHALLAGSPALDAGNPVTPGGPPACLANDQRNQARPGGARCDIGAYEAAAATRIAFSTSPGDGLAGAAFPTQPVVVATDSQGNLAPYNGPITLALSSTFGLAGARLNGTTTVNAVNGVATFSGLSVDQPGSYRLVASAGPLGSATSALFTVAAAPAPGPLAEVEPNGDIENANLLVFDQNGNTARVGTIAAPPDGDWFVLSARPGATVAISLTNLPGDYDLALVSDPRVTIPGSDGVNLRNITDAGRVDAAGELDALSRIEAISQITQIGRIDPTGRVQALSTNDELRSESIVSTLSPGGLYYLFVYSSSGDSDPTQQYRLDVSMRGGTLEEPSLKAQTVASLNAQPDESRRTIFLFNSARMYNRYPDQGAAISRLIGALGPGASAIANSDGVAIDLGGTSALPEASANLLRSLYNQWDAAPDQPLLANQVAQQIWNVLDRAMRSYYPGTTNLVLVGGDDIIPFYRIPDETLRSHEGDYYAQLKATGQLVEGTPLAASLRDRLIQTDNFYADRQPTPWRGRALYLPDLGIGRLVERPDDIMRYLDAYSAPSNYIIQGDATASYAGAALVTGYDFMKDQAAAIAAQLDAYGFRANGTLGATPQLDQLNNDSWRIDDLTSTLFSGQLGMLTNPYNGPYTRYHLMSLNGHFSHYEATPANPAGPGDVFAAQRLLTPTVALGSPSAAYFKNGPSAALLFSIGCHAGLSASDAAFAPGADRLQADFASAVLKQGGNWISNTGYGYGDEQAIGYSERLALLFTTAIGRRIEVNNLYQGAMIGESLARAKRQYLQGIGPGSFSVYDEKTLAEFTLYGLPFIRVKVPTPAAPQFGASFDPLPVAVAAPVAPTGVFTRVITLNNTFSVPGGPDDVPQVTSVVQDSFVANAITIVGQPQMLPGRPVLPALTYDLSSLPSAPGGGIPQVRGVRLRAATTLPDLASFDPHATDLITDHAYIQADPALRLQAEWLPDQPYSFQRAPAGASALYDTLTVIPVQFQAGNWHRGRLRRFSQMVFEITYLDPSVAPTSEVNCQHCEPAFTSVVAVRCPGRRRCPGLGSVQLAQAAGEFLLLSAEVVDNLGRPLARTSATYTIDGVTWQRVELTRNPANGAYEAMVPAPAQDAEVYAFFEALDSAGNATIASDFTTNHRVFVPILSRPGLPDLVGSISLSPDKRSFVAGEPVQIAVTITNRGSGTSQPAWADLFINPSNPPTAANTIWNYVCGMTPCFGLAWQVPALGPGQSVTLTSAPGSYAAGYSFWPGWFARGTSDLYLYVDSWNPGVASGAVAENDEANNRAELHGLSVTGVNPALVSATQASAIPQRPE